MSGKKIRRTAIIFPALCALGSLSSCLFAEDAGIIGGISGGGSISADNHLTVSAQGIAGAFDKWGGESVGNSGSGFVYAASSRKIPATERIRFTRRAPDPDKPPMAGKASFSRSRPEVKVSIDATRSISFGLETAVAKPKSNFSVKNAKAYIPASEISDFKPGENDEVKYSEVEEGVDLYYQARGNRLEEDIVLRKPPKKNTFSFNLNTQGLAAMPQADGTIHFQDDQTGQVMFYFEKPFMADSAGIRSEKVYLKPQNPEKLVIEADADWLKDTTRQYPVVIDPTLVFVTTFSFFGGTEPLLRITKDNSSGLYMLSRSYNTNGISGLGYNYSNNGGETWSPTEITTTAVSCPRCAIAVDSARKTHIIFGTNAPYSIAYINNINEMWSAPELISANTTFFQPISHDWGDYAMTLVSDSADNLHLIWPSSNEGGTIYYSKKPPGGNWTNPQAVNDPLTQPLHNAAMTVDSNNKLHLIGWYDYTGGYAVYVNTLAGTWSTPEVIYSSYCGWGSVAVDNNNKPHVALYTSWWKIAYLNKAQSSWSNPLSLKCRSHAIIGTDKNNNTHIICEPGGSLSGGVYPIRQLYQLNNINGVWGPSVHTPFDRVMGSMDVVLDKESGAWHIAMLHGGPTGGFAGDGPISYYRLDDLIPPALIRDLKAVPGISSGTIALTWTAPGDDGMSGTASRYDAKVATYPIINQDDYDLLPVYSSWTAPRPAYSPESQVLAGLTGGVTYYIAVLSFDDQNNASYVTSSTNIVAGTVTPLALSSWSVSAVAASADTYILPPGGLTGAVLPDLSVKLEWSPSPSTTTVASYSVYWDSGTGTMDYILPLASVVSPATSYTTISLSTGLYRFGVRSLAGNGIEEANTGVVITVNVDTAAVVVPVRAEIKVPQSGKRIAGNRVTVMAELTIGSPALVREVLFQYRAAGSSSTAWSPIPAAGYNHPNPDASAPYFIHWDLSALPDWDYELRAAATNIYGQTDPAPPSIFVSIDAVNPQLEEKTVGASQQKRTEVYNTVANTVQVGAESGAVVSVALPAGALTETSATLKAVSNPPAVPPAESALLTAGQNFELTLESGQTQLNAPAALALYYPDADNDGYLDGTELRADKLGMYYYDTTGAKWTRLAGSAVNGGAKTVTAQTTHFSLFGLFAPAASDLSAVLVYPVPYVPNDGNPDNGRPYSATDPDSGILFDNLTQAVKIELFTLSGELVWKKATDSSGGKLRWDAKNSSGREVASGGYFAVITSPVTGGKVVRKLAIIR